MCLHLFFKMPSLISVIAKGLSAVTLDLGKVVDIGIVAEKSLARRRVRGLWSRDLNEGEVMAIIQSAIVSPGDHEGRPLQSLASKSGRKQPVESFRLRSSLIFVAQGRRLRRRLRGR